MRGAASRGVARAPRPPAWRRAPRRGACTRVPASPGDEPRDALGGQDFIYSQRSGVAETLFKGDLLGVDADVVADLRARGESSRDLSFIRGTYHVPERFLERFATHVAKNLLVNDEVDDVGFDGTGASDGTKKNTFKNTTRRSSGLRAAGVPLILGIWGGKGCGKTFNVELCCRDMGITPFVVSAGELEDPVAGEPGAALRRAYVAAADEAARRGTPTVLVVNDLDAGVARFRDDKVTVNNQIVQASLMNLCDTPTAVALGDPKRADRRDWDSREERARDDDGDQRADAKKKKRFGNVKCRRVPIVVTGNDFSRLYAPLTRSGRMDMWHWEPSRSEIAEMLHATLAPAAGEDAGTFGYGGEEDARALVARFPDQPLDFFAAARAACADDAVRAWVKDGGLDSERASLRTRNVKRFGFGSPPKQDVSLPALLRAATRIAREQQNVLDANLAREYVNAWTENLSADEIRARRRADAARARAPEARNVLDADAAERAERLRAARADAEARARAETRGAARAAAEALSAASAEAARLGLTSPVLVGVRNTPTLLDGEEALARDETALAETEASRAWATWDCVRCYRARKENPRATLFVDVRPRKAFDRETVKGAVSCPAAVTRGTVAEPVTERDVAGAARAFREALGAPENAACDVVVVVGDGGGDGGYAREALSAFHEALSSSDSRHSSTTLVEMREGIDGWLKRYTPGGAPRPRYVGYGKDNEETMFTASN